MGLANGYLGLPLKRGACELPKMFPNLGACELKVSNVGA